MALEQEYIKFGGRETQLKALGTHYRGDYTIRELLENKNWIAEEHFRFEGYSNAVSGQQLVRILSPVTEQRFFDFKYLRTVLEVKLLDAPKYKYAIVKDRETGKPQMYRTNGPKKEVLGEMLRAPRQFFNSRQVPINEDLYKLLVVQSRRKETSVLIKKTSKRGRCTIKKWGIRDFHKALLRNRSIFKSSAAHYLYIGDDYRLLPLINKL